MRALNALRVHGPGRAAIGFRSEATHRFSHPDIPGGLLYLGLETETCLWERFGDELLDGQARLAKSVWTNSRLSRVRSTDSLKICDLTDDAARLRLGVDLTALMHSDLAVPQAWGLAIFRHPATVDGLRYLSRLNQQPCLVLFERPGLAARLKETLVGTLPDLDEASEFLTNHAIALV